MDTRLWMVCQDGAAIKRGLSRTEAERYADYLARGYESHRANDKRRVAEFTIKEDKSVIDKLYHSWKNS